ncbi:MAG: N-acetylmuramoyl-L-alanine amidase [Magnetococcales bacterium]|nr:N-acetylmuramoyl-L-alanine amidase [Magnetococcales bacterium]
MERRHLLKALAISAGGLLLPRGSAWAAIPAKITDVRLWTAPDHTRVVFDMDRSVDHRLFTLKAPDRVVLDIPQATLSRGVGEGKLTDALVRGFRVGNPQPGTVRAVFETQGGVKPRAFFLGANSDKTHRLVVDFYTSAEARQADAQKGRQAEIPERASAPKARDVAKAGKEPVKEPVKGPVQVQNRRGGQRRGRDAVVVIDAGHGGEDPGAIGPNGTREKDITLSVAKKLAAKIDATPGLTARLTRTGDYYVSLRKRVTLARSFRPDLFISLHADAFRDRSARGASVYCLSERGKPAPDRAIRALVRRENSADLLGGVDLDDVNDPEVRGILMDLSQRDSINRGLVLGWDLLSSLKSVPNVRLHRRSVKQAGFAVLKAPDVPSVLVELAFLTNREEEIRLRDTRHQEHLAGALLMGTSRYVRSANLA